MKIEITLRARSTKIEEDFYSSWADKHWELKKNLGGCQKRGLEPDEVIGKI